MSAGPTGAGPGRGERERHLVIRLGRLGDMVMLTPALRLLLDRPDPPLVTLLTNHVGRLLLSGFDPGIESARVPDRSGPRRIGWAGRTGRWIRDQDFDVVWLFETSPRYARLVRGAQGGVHRLEDRAGPVNHFAERCSQMVDSGGSGPPWAAVPVTAEASATAERVLRTAGLGPHARLLGLHPGFSGAARVFRRDSGDPAHPKAWPLGHWATLARRLAGRARESGGTVVIAPSDEERPIADRIRSEAGDALIVLPPVPDLATYAALLSRYALLVAPDTGPGHLAAAVGTPVVSLFSVKDPADCAPYAPPERVRVLRAEDRPGSGRSLATLSPDVVFEAASTLIV